MISAIKHLSSSIGYNLISLSIEGAAHRAVDVTALATKTSATLVNNWIITPAAWFLIGLAAQSTTYVVKKTAAGVYHFFTPAQEAPVLLIADADDLEASNTSVIA